MKESEKKESLIDFSNKLIPHDSLCWKEDSGIYELEIAEAPALLLEEDFDDYLIDHVTDNLYGGWGDADSIREEMESIREYWSSLGFECSDEEWDEWERQTYGYLDEGEQVWPPTDESDYYDGTINYDPYSKKRQKKKKGLSSQKFINGIEVDDAEFSARNSRPLKKGTRRGGKKHNRSVSHKIRYNYNDWEDSHYNDSVSWAEERSSIYFDEKKKIIFYKDIRNTADTLEFTKLDEFSEWVDMNDIHVDRITTSDILYSVTTHCCLDPNSSEKKLIASRTFSELLWEALDGDDTRLDEVGEVLRNKSAYII